jgi:hypothetical protein
LTADDFEAYVAALGFPVERATDSNNIEYTVVRDLEITKGGLRGKRCDVALQRVTTIPYVVPTAIHTHPVLVVMHMQDPLKTQPSALGQDWQYWSRRFAEQTPTSQRVWAHILTILNDDRWTPV